MSSANRPWYPWYPKDFGLDEKVQSLSDDAELLYRRVLDVLWQANDQQLPNACQKLANALARGWDQKRFDDAWSEIQFPGFELLKTSDDGKWLYSKRLKKEAEKIKKISKNRSKIGRKGGQAKAKQKPSKSQKEDKQKGSHSDTYIDTYNTPPLPPPDGDGVKLYEFYLQRIDPESKSRQRAITNANYYLKSHPFEDLHTAIRNYSSRISDKGTGRQYRKDPANFFGKKDPTFVDFLPGVFAPPKPKSSGRAKIAPLPGEHNP